MNSTEVSMEFAKALKKNMQHSQLGVAMLSRKTKITRGLIYKYLRGEIYPNAENMSLLLTVLNVDLRSFYNV